MLTFGSIKYWPHWAEAIQCKQENQTFYDYLLSKCLSNASVNAKPMLKQKYTGTNTVWKQSIHQKCGRFK